MFWILTGYTKCFAPQGQDSIFDLTFFKINIPSAIAPEGQNKNCD